MDQELQTSLLASRVLVHSPDGSTYLREMTLWSPAWKYDVKLKIRLCQSMHTYLKDNPA